MTEPAHKAATYDDLLQVPAHQVAEIVDGEFLTRPRPSSTHALASSALGTSLFDPFHRKPGGPGTPGGWWIPIEPELRLLGDVLVDTSGFYATLVRADDRHADAASYLQLASADLAGFVTTDYVLDETATLLRACGKGHLVEPLFEAVFTSQVCRVEWMDPERFGATRAFFEKHSDHGWSFTDCFSFVLMTELDSTEALTKDRHFREAGFTPLLA